MTCMICKTGKSGRYHVLCSACLGVQAWTWKIARDSNQLPDRSCEEGSAFGEIKK